MFKKCGKISGINRIEVLDELKLLLADDEILYNCPDKKQDLLMSYAKACENCTSGGTVLVPIAAICENLEHKAEWMMKTSAKTNGYQMARMEAGSTDIMTITADRWKDVRVEMCA